ncbi:MAG: hypothetical protein EOO10_22725 [Chitinophagaceae bacterium]|nr:MAG: hypothetical protein EOO10_22725 [Chitinophagaceae bacterium]
MTLFFRKYLFLLALPLVLASCNDDDESSLPVPPNHPCRLVTLKLQRDNGDTVIINNYSYLASGRLSRINKYNHNTEELETFRVLAYNNAGLPKTITTYIGHTLFPGNHAVEGYNTYSYNPQGLKTITRHFINLSGQQNFVHDIDYTYEYNAEKQVVKQTQQELSSYYTYEYDLHGNVTRADRFETDLQTNAFVLKYYTKYEYDNNPSLYSALFRHFWEHPEELSPNNATRITNYNPDGTIRENQDFNFTFTYNTKGYPTSRSYAASGTGYYYPKVFFEYECK